MEPMTLGSPGGSPAAGSPYLPSFLMGDSSQPATPRNNTLSPTKGGRTVSFATPSGMTSPQDYSRQNMEQRSLFNHQDTPTRGNFPGTPTHGNNTSVSGPPTQGLFDLLRAERNEVQTPTKMAFNMNQSHIGTPGPSSNINQSFNESYLNHTGLNGSRIVSPVAQFNNPDYRSNISMNMLNYPPTTRHNDFWITVFGFPQSATNMILAHFSQCGTIIDKVFPTQSGNWVHLKFSSRLECDKALNYNEKILGNNIMIGVTHCKDTSIVDKENLCDNNQMSRVRPLAQVAYKTAQCDSAVVACPTAPQRSSGIVNKAMDLLFGW